MEGLVSVVGDYRVKRDPEIVAAELRTHIEDLKAWLDERGLELNTGCGCCGGPQILSNEGGIWLDECFQ